MRKLRQQPSELIWRCRNLYGASSGTARSANATSATGQESSLVAKKKKAVLYVCKGCKRMQSKFPDAARSRGRIDNAKPRKKNENVWEWAVEHRRSPPPHESKLLTALRRNGFTVCHQQVMPPYICDFYLPNQNVIIELDGSQHKKTKEYDDRRTRLLMARYGVTEVIRVWNAELNSRMSTLVEELRGLPRRDAVVPPAGSVGNPL